MKSNALTMTGETISHYRVLEKLGEGGMGVVYKGQDTKLDRFVALKFLPPHLSASEQDKARFIQEAKAAAALSHPNVCSVFDLQEANGQQFIVMEFVEGVTLRDKVPLSNESEILDYATQIGEALQAAHAKGIVHRDVKPENIMVTPHGRIKVMDFGLAILRGASRLTKQSSVVGTLAYSAPEQIQGCKVDARADLFSFGIMLFEMMTGHLPFRGEHDAALMYSIVNEEPQPLKKYVPDASSVLDSLIAKSLRKDPAERYQSAAEMLNDLKSGSTAERGGQAPAKETKNSLQTSVRKHRLLLEAFVALLAFAALLALFILTRDRPAREVRKSIAVLPFENLSGDEENEYVSDGITEDYHFADFKNIQRQSDFANVGDAIQEKQKTDQADCGRAECSHHS